MTHLAALVIAYFLFVGIRTAWRNRQRKRAEKKWAQAPQRDVSAVADVGQAEFKQEVIKTSGTLKPNHRRLILRDNRLLPKPPPDPKQRRWPPPPRTKYLTEHEADRLFGPSLRTRNRDVMDLAIDEAQLERYGLPLWKTEDEVAAALSLTPGKLRYFSQHRFRETASHYVTFAIPKRSGGERIIHAPKRQLKAVLRRLDHLLVSKLPVSEHAHGFLQGRSVATNAAPHVGKAVVLHFDIKDCFPTIHYGRVRGLLIALGYSYPVAAALAVLMTESPRQPVVAEGKTYQVPTGPRVCVQGAPTSPGLCNAILLRLDHRLAGLARKHGFAYTRYADDLTFSGNDTKKIAKLLKLVPQIISEEGFAANTKKTRVMRAGRRQAVTGVVVNEEMGLSRQERRKLRAALHRQNTSPDVDAHERMRLEGKLAYLYMLNRDQASALGWKKPTRGV
ncbi:reverse transcriptase family protein [Hyphomicrobium sp. 2TAF46]|uniref:reverse transcriptase family protein n=1 Tax=Hyphomicrobium sp. 2TAF46 TaxID=3233019 RepID=UPI003F90249D